MSIISIKFPLCVAIERAAISDSRADYDVLVIVLEEALKFAERCRDLTPPKESADVTASADLENKLD